MLLGLIDLRSFVVVSSSFVVVCAALPGDLGVALLKSRAPIGLSRVDEGGIAVHYSIIDDSPFMNAR